MLSSTVFNTKRYTIESLITEVSNLKPSQTTSVSVIAQALSPRVGVYGAKLAFLNDYVGGNLEGVINGRAGFRTYGKSSRTRILNALRRRQSV